ncbi:hypothetical protein [Sulfitobacter pontiacus]|nr:hypothetical protein [Sulfitobacter pontiacus]
MASETERLGHKTGGGVLQEAGRANARRTGQEVLPKGDLRQA